MLARWSAGLAVAANAVAFSLKHAVVDVSLGPLFSLIALGAVLALTYRRLGLTGSISAHIAANVVATTFSWPRSSSTWRRPPFRHLDWWRSPSSASSTSARMKRRCRPSFSDGSNPRRA